MATTTQPDESQNLCELTDIVGVPLGMESPAFIPEGVIAKFDRHGQIPLGHEQIGETEYLLALKEADKVLTAKGLSKEQRERICRLLEYVAPSRTFARGPEAKEVAELLDSLVWPGRLLELLRQAEKAGRLRPMTADALNHAFQMHNSAIFIAKRIQNELGLILLAPKFRQSRTGRPNLFMAALVADAVADELRAILGQPQWPVVAAVLRPFMKLLSPAMVCDKKHVPQLVVTNKKRAKHRIQKRETTESWDDSKALLYQHAGLTRPPETR